MEHHSQALDAAVHWMAWVLQQQAMPIDDVLPTSQDQIKHAAQRILGFLDELSAPDNPAGQPSGSGAHLEQLKRLYLHTLQWLIQVGTCSEHSKTYCYMQVCMAWSV